MTILFITLLIIPNVSASSKLHYKYTMSYIFENKGSKPLNLTKEDVSVPIFHQNENQLSKITSSTNKLTEEYTDADNNRWLIVDVPFLLNPGQKISFSVTYEIESFDKIKPNFNLTNAEGVEEVPLSLINEFCIPTSSFMSNDSKILSKALSITQNYPTVLGKVMSLIEWFNSNIKYETNEVPRYASDTFKYLKGDCDDQAILLISMLRGLGIPSYMEVGIYFNPGYYQTEKSWEAHLTLEASGLGWHGWAMVYIPPWGWVPVDLTLIKNSDPLIMLNEAPEYSNKIFTCFNVSKQEYVKESWETRERVIKSTLYVSAKDEATQIWTLPIYNPNIQFLGISISVLILIMFLIERKRQQYPL